MTQWKTFGLRSWILGAAAVAAMGAGIVGSQFRHVDISVQGPKGKHQYSLWTFSGQVKNILQQAGVKVTRHDRISPAMEAQVASRPIKVQDAIPVWIKTAHQRIQVWTTHYSVQAALDAANIKLGPLDEVRPALNAKLTSATTVNVIRRWLVTARVKQKIPFVVRHVPDSSMPTGHTAVQVQGRDGLRVKVVQRLMQDGRVVKTRVLKTEEVKPPVAEVIQYGTTKPVSRGGTVLQFSEAIQMYATAYWPDPAWSSGYTYTGLKAQYGVAAVDPSVIPLGSHLYVPGYGFAIAADIGGGIKGDRIDLCYDTAAQADSWGVKELTVYVLSTPTS